MALALIVISESCENSINSLDGGLLTVTLNVRQAGVLLHPTSLPGPYGIGDLGPEAVRFLDWMRSAGFGLWQVLPLGPTGYGDSPYQCFSAFAGNHFLISPDRLREAGLLTRRDIGRPSFPRENVDYGPVIEWKNTLLERAWQRYQSGSFPEIKKGIKKFRKSPTVAPWLENYALFIALKKAHGGAVWNTWDKPLRACKPKAIEKATEEHADEIEYQVFLQYLFFDQWKALRAEAHKRDITIVGDMPIYVAYDSADTWSNQSLFKLQKDGTPTSVAGVPPDYFSETGQLWGNPIYDYKKMKKNGFAWWIRRIHCITELVDYIRLDHFRGFEAYWEVPAGETTAINGKWVPGPGAKLFDAIRKELGVLPIIAENLGVITKPVEDLREQFNLPGMKVLQFAWGAASIRPPIPDPDSVFQPHKIDKSSVVYTGTHDNPTTAQWWKEFASPDEKKIFKAYLNADGRKPVETLVRAAYASVADTVLVPMQDLLGLGGEARMNFPGRESGNWGWRMRKDAASRALAKRCREELLLYDRHVHQRKIADELLAQQSEEQRARKP